MTENRKRVSVSIASGGRSAEAAVTRGAATRTVEIAALPVRPVDTDPYEGIYTVEPSFSRQTLQTNGKRMTDDLTVNPIYVGDTTNPAGGVTIYIGVGGENNG